MSVDGRVTSGTSEVLVLSVRDMKVRFGITVLLCQTKVNNIDLVSTLPDSHQEVVGLDVSMNE